jgi:hypothetical protein
MSERAEYLLHKPWATADLCCPCNARANAQRDTQCNNQCCYAIECVQMQMPLTIMMTVIATIIVTCQHTYKTTAPSQLNRLQQATISWYWHNRSWGQTVVGQQDDRFIQQLSLLLAHTPKVTACATVPTNASDATWTTIIVNAFLS